LAVGHIRSLPGHQAKNSTLLIEAGTKGWELIEFQEIYASAVEYLGSDHVIQYTVESTGSYPKNVYRKLKDCNATHYFYDPRSGSQNFFRGIGQSIMLAAICAWLKVYPIAWLTDFQVRRWRNQCLALTANAGVCATVASSTAAQRWFPHKRLLGPLPLPISSKQMDRLQSLRSLQRTVLENPNVSFSGSLYEPRTTDLMAIREGLRNRGFDLTLNTRSLGGIRRSNLSYWSELASSDIILTTSTPNQNSATDDLGVGHLIFRYTEAIAAGGLLIAPAVPGISRYFLDGTHFISFSCHDEAISRICFYLENPLERERVREQGAMRAQAISDCNLYWVAIDSALGKHGLI